MAASRSCPLLSLLVVLVGLALPWHEAAALSSIRHEEWSYQGDVPQAPQSTLVGVSFFASVGDMDLPSRVMFTIVVKDEAGDEHPLLHYRWGRWEEIAGPGTPINVFASFRLSCDGQGMLTAEPVETWFGFCNRSQVPLDIRNLDNVQVTPVQTTGRFGLDLVDRGGYHGKEPTPRGAFGCSGAAASGPSVEAVRADLSLKKSIRANQIANGNAGSVGLYFDMFGRNCSGTILPDRPDTVYVVAKMDEMSACGIAGAEFRFTGVPASWSTFPVAAPDMLTVGDPLGDGVTVGFRCKREEAGFVVLYSVLVLANAVEEDLQFHIEKRAAPTGGPDFDCPLLVLCDFPAFTKICVEGIPCNINARKPTLCVKPTAVTTSTWSVVKNLFR